MEMFLLVKMYDTQSTQEKDQFKKRIIASLIQVLSVTTFMSMISTCKLPTYQNCITQPQASVQQVTK